MEGQRQVGNFCRFALAALVTLTGCAPENPSSAPLPFGKIAQPGAVASARYLLKLKAPETTGDAQTLGHVNALQAFSIRSQSDERLEPVRDDLVMVTFPDAASAPDRLEHYLASPDLEYAEPDVDMHLFGHTNDPQAASQWAHQTVDSFGAWDLTTGSRDVIVGIIDTGTDPTHEDLAANIWKNTKEIPGNGKDDDGNGFVDDTYGWNFNSNNATPVSDDFPNFHGCHTSGTVGAVGGNGVGVSGHAQKVQIMPLKFLGSNGSGDVANAVRAVDYAIKMGAKILNNSWGSTTRSQALAEAIDRARAAGILFVAAAGNGGQDGVGDNNDQVPTYPASYTHDNILAVAATTQSDSLTSFSNFGARTVHVAAPGQDILSTQNGNKYGYLSGTSMATPLVVGVAALMKAAKPTATYAAIKAALIQSSDPVPALQGKVVANGRVNARKAVALISGAPDPNPNPNPDPDPNPNPNPNPNPQPGTKARAPTLNGQTALAVGNPNVNILVAYDVSEFQGAAGVYFEVSRPNQGFSNPNGNMPDPYRLYYLYGTGPRNQATLIPARDLPNWGTYSFRVIALDTNGHALGVFSDPSVLQLQPGMGMQTLDFAGVSSQGSDLFQSK